MGLFDGKFYVYTWINDNTGQPFYVGKGRRERMLRGAGCHRSNGFNEVYLNNPCHWEIIQEFNNDQNKEAARCEIETIKRFTEQGYPLVNRSKGGEPGVINQVISEETKAEYSQRFKGKNNPNYNHKWSDEQKQHLSRLKTEARLSKGARNGRAKPVMDVETGIIYAYMRDASADIGVKDGSGSIYFCLKDKFRVAGKVRHHFVGQEMFDQLKTPEQRMIYLENLKKEKQLRRRAQECA